MNPDGAEHAHSALIMWRFVAGPDGSDDNFMHVWSRCTEGKLFLGFFGKFIVHRNISAPPYPSSFGKILLWKKYCVLGLSFYLGIACISRVMWLHQNSVETGNHLFPWPQKNPTFLVMFAERVLRPDCTMTGLEFRRWYSPGGTAKFLNPPPNERPPRAVGGPSIPANGVWALDRAGGPINVRLKVVSWNDRTSSASLIPAPLLLPGRHRNARVLCGGATVGPFDPRSQTTSEEFCNWSPSI